MNSVSQSQPVIKPTLVETCTATNLKSQDYLTCKNAWGETTHQMLNYRTILFIFSYIPDQHHKCRQEKNQRYCEVTLIYRLKNVIFKCAWVTFNETECPI